MGDGIREGIAAGASFHSWEDPEVDADFLSLCDSDSMFDADSDFDGNEMGEEDAFIAYTTDLLISKNITAQQFCVQMYLLGRAGLRKAAALGMPPDRPTGHYQRKLDRHVGRDSAQRRLHIGDAWLQCTGARKSNSDDVHFRAPRGGAVPFRRSFKDEAARIDRQRRAARCIL